MPSTIRPSPKMLSTVVVIGQHVALAVDHREVRVPPGSRVLSLPTRGAPGKDAIGQAGPAVVPIRAARPTM